MSLISTSTSSEDAAASAQLVIEAIVEDIKVKRELFARLDKAAPRCSMCMREHVPIRVCVVCVLCCKGLSVYVHLSCLALFTLANETSIEFKRFSSFQLQ